jgi:DNA segregation ATPase FtsK/SpoIIIE-like protein
MNESINLILKKLDEIEKRIIKLEGKEVVKEEIEKEFKGSYVSTKKDPLFNQAWEIILNEQDDVSVSYLAEKLKISQERASLIMDQLAEAGFGVCYTKEV